MTKKPHNTQGHGGDARITRGPTPERLKIDGDWATAAARLVQVKKPADGWPDAKPKPKRKAAKKAKRK